MTMMWCLYKPTLKFPGISLLLDRYSCGSMLTLKVCVKVFVSSHRPLLKTPLQIRTSTSFGIISRTSVLKPSLKTSPQKCCHLASANHGLLGKPKDYPEGRRGRFVELEDPVKPEDSKRYKRLQKDVRFECRKTYNSYVRDTVSSDKNSKKLYSFIKSKRCESSGVSPLKSTDGLAYNDPKIKATRLNNKFSGAFTAEDHSHLPSMDGEPFPAMHSFTITCEGVWIRIWLPVLTVSRRGF